MLNAKILWKIVSGQIRSGKIEQYRYVLTVSTQKVES
jgi:hypothetical protein